MRRMTDTLTYRGDGKPPAGRKGEPYPYLADEGLVTAVNVAIHLGRPLLVKGPPGSGKTAVAYALAHELGVPLFPWYVKSTSRARDGLYDIDMVRRLQDAQLDEERAQRLTPYIRFGPLGKALRTPGPSVVLIDEVDKADIDFPNDLLRELDERRFTIEELEGTSLTAEEERDGWRATYGRPQDAPPSPGDPRPVVVITSNDEKELPDAFLRRCVFHYIQFPGTDRLQRIVDVNTRKEGLRLDAALVRAAIRWLEELRRQEGVRKKPETSELIDWVRVLHHWKVDVAALRDAAAPGELPYLEVLYKHQADLVKVRGADGAAA
jgi:MoxR-like ATPase